MKALVKSLMAELFPGLVKEEVIQRRSRMGPRRAIAAQQSADRESKPAFGKRGGFRAGATRPRRQRDKGEAGTRF